MILLHGFGPADAVFAQPIPPGTVPIEEDIKITKHNLSSSGLGTVKSTETSEICVFCHTPHGSSATASGIKAPIWNRNIDYQNTQSYTLYDNTWSFSFEGTLNDPNKPTGYSRLCLSCHDGTIAIGTVVNKPESGGYLSTTIGMTGVQPGGQMPLGSGGFTGDTRNLGRNLQNDHPISFRFDSALATVTDTELVDPGPPPAGINDATPLAPAGGYKTGVKRYGSTVTPMTFENVQCTSCHNPHAVTYPKFLRASRFQDASESGFLPCSPTPCIGGGGPTPATGQIICLYCHSKPGWSPSTHSVSTAIHAAYPLADDTATPDPENYDFDGIHTVGAYACRNCHDPHTAQGAKRIHKEGVTTFGGSDAVENTCFLCHAPNEKSVNDDYIANLLPAGDKTSSTNPRFLPNATARNAPDIFSEFNKDNSTCAGGSGTGSAMCLQLPTLVRGHDPVFISRSQEGVQLKSEGLAMVPVLNEEPPGSNTPDEAHIECVDCHNPHQVNSPNLLALSYNGAPNVAPPGLPNANGEGGRLKGMKGIGIDVTGTRPIVVGRCEPGFVICGTDITINAKHPLLATKSSADRDPYVYEVCFRCHGNSYTNLFGPISARQYRNPDDVIALNVPQNYASYVSIPFSPRTDPTNGPTGDQFSYMGFSNKWREFNPLSHDLDTPPMISVDLARFGTAVFSHTQQPNPAYHPVVVPGRNGSPQLCKQLAAAFGISNCQTPADTLPSAGAATSALSNLTIQCTDCHNNNKYDAYNNLLSITPVTGFSSNSDRGFLGPLTESNLRPTDVWPGLNFRVDYITGRPSQPIGPHGSIHRRLLRANYDTNILAPGRCFEQQDPPGCASGDGYSGSGVTHGIAGGGAGSNPSHFQKFLLCFQCHDRAAFDPAVTTTYYGQTTLGDKDRSLTRFFGLAPSSAGVDSWWNGNLHMYHLRWSGAMCHECHYNVHSNIEALNTIYGDGHGGGLADDGVDGMPDGVRGTHLINFGPLVEGTTNHKPMWFYDGSAFRCYLRCHNEVMDSCAYQATSTGTPNARWCAGGRNPGTSG
jgi:predicted CXXCH cytochrome family protein